VKTFLEGAIRSGLAQVERGLAIQSAAKNRPRRVVYGQAKDQKAAYLVKFGDSDLRFSNIKVWFSAEIKKIMPYTMHMTKYYHNHALLKTSLPKKICL
jgi:hypothetical protein